MKNDLNNLKILKNIAIILVLLGHAGCIYAGKWSCSIVNTKSEYIKYVTEYIYSIHMPLFVFISGFIYSFNREIMNKYNNVIEFIRNKFKRLIIPYVLTGVFFMIPIQMLFEVYTDRKTFFIRVLEEIILSNRPAHLWYLIMLFNLFVIFRLFEKQINKRGYLFNFAMFSVLKVFSVIIPNIYQISAVFQYGLYFYMGYTLCREAKKIKDIRLNLNILFIIHFILFNLNYFILQNLEGHIYIKLIKLSINIIISMVGIMYIYILGIRICNNDIYQKIQDNKMYNLIDKYNFEIYLLHQPIMLSIIEILKNYNIKPMEMYFTLFMVTLIVTLILAMIVSKINIYIKNRKRTLVSNI